MFVQKLNEFFFEGFDPMMFLLILYVLNQSIFLLHGVRECPITILPTSEERKELFPLDKVGGGELDILNEISERDGWMQMCDDMDMIFRPIHSVHVAFPLIEQSDNVAIQFVSVLFHQRPFPTFGGKDDLIQDLSIGAHARLVNPFRVDVML